MIIPKKSKLTLVIMLVSVPLSIFPFMTLSNVSAKSKAINSSSFKKISKKENPSYFLSSRNYIRNLTIKFKVKSKTIYTKKIKIRAGKALNISSLLPNDYQLVNGKQKEIITIKRNFPSKLNIKIKRVANHPSGNSNSSSSKTESKKAKQGYQSSSLNSNESLKKSGLGSGTFNSKPNNSNGSIQTSSLNSKKANFHSASSTSISNSQQFNQINQSHNKFQENSNNSGNNSQRILSEGSASHSKVSSPEKESSILKQSGSKSTQQKSVSINSSKSDSHDTTTNFKGPKTSDNNAIAQPKRRNVKSVNKAVPVNPKNSTPLPSQPVNSPRQPELVPDNSNLRISSASNFSSEVPFNSNTDIERDMSKIEDFKDFSKSVLKWKPFMDKVVKHYQMQRYETLLLAIMQNESQGNEKKVSDIMQSSESAGLKPNSLDPQQSIEQAVKYLKSITNKATQMDYAEQQNKNINPTQYHDYSTDYRMLAQVYNYGPNFLDYVSKQKSGFTLKVSENYSKDIIAPKLGNITKAKYSYKNNISKMYHKPYLYKNGGNFFYSDLVAQYMITGFMKNIVKQTAKDHVIGSKYVWGGKNPKTGFDCSGFTSYYLSKVGVHLPSYTVSQWEKTKSLSRLNRARPGDLIFFKGTYGTPNFISHVGFIIDRHTMFDADGNGVGFHDLNNSYWKKHYAGVRRLKNAGHINQMANSQFNKQISSISTHYSDVDTLHVMEM